jgi:serine/threonine-protein kinase
MELLTGDDLAMVLDDQGEIRPVKAVRTMLPLAHGLAAAHDKKVVHRDLKPENILLAEKEGGGIQPKIIDFGLAKTRIPRRKRLTQIGDAFGTPDYMSPEQMRGEDVSAQADVWAFSVVLYEMLCGQPPFEGENFRVVMRKILEADPVPITTLGVGDADLWAIIEKGLAKDTRRRWSSMRDLGTALARWLLDQVPPPSAQAAAPALTATSPDSSGQPLAPQQPVFGPPPSAGSPAAAPPAYSPGAGDVAAAGSPSAAAVTARTRTTRAGRHSSSATVWLVLLWLLTLAGIAGAVTGYLGIPLPGIPARAPAGDWWPLSNPAAADGAKAPTTMPTAKP